MSLYSALLHEAYSPSEKFFDIPSFPQLSLVISPTFLFNLGNTSKAGSVDI